MTRKLLIDALAEVCSECGFAFETGFAYRIAPELRQLPAAWLEPPKLHKTEGREEGVKHYAVKLILLSVCNEHTAGSKEECWAQLEEKASAILLLTGAKERVRTITDIKFSPAEFSLTAAGELSMELNFNVQVAFCNYCDYKEKG